MSDLEIRVTVLGPEYTRDTGYGPRQERDTWATLDVPVDHLTAWRIFQTAVADATAPTVEIERT